MKVCILAAGRGTRVTGFGARLHKGLLPLGNLGVISRIIEGFPSGARFVIALGHHADQIRDYCRIVHPDLPVSFVMVDNFDQPGAGPGYSLWCCREHLAEPFYLTACDTLVTTPVPPLTRNFIGVETVDDPTLWCTAELDAGRRVRKLHYKSPQGTRHAFIGLAGVVDHAAFWSGLGQGVGSKEEFQVDAGLEALVPAGLEAIDMGWVDTGTDDHYRQALTRYEKNYTVFGKTTDVTYRSGDRMIKFFPEPGSAESRYRRGRENAGFASPLDLVGRFFSYRFVPGTMLSSVIDGPRCLSALRWLEAHFWRPRPFDAASFETVSRRFYGEKTLARLDDYVARHGDGGEPDPLILNGLPCRSIRQALDDMPATFWRAALPSTFHGDLHDGNIVIAEDESLVMIDWRQDFAGLPDVGDRYYDLAKFLHTLDLTVPVMDDGDYAIREAPDGLRIEHHCPAPVVAARAAFWQFTAEAGYDRSRIELLNALIFVNMAPLYDARMARYLYLLGRLRLEQALRGIPLA